jgi:hypothetical protein
MGEIKRKSLKGDNIETIVSNGCYGFSYVSDKGIYALGNNLVFIDDASNKITTVININIMTGRIENSGIGSNATEEYITRIIQIDEKYIYYSEVQSASPGFSSCTDESEALLKYDIYNNKNLEINRMSGEANYYQDNNIVYIIGTCDDTFYRVLNLTNDKISKVVLGVIKYFEIDKERIYWVNNNSDLLVRERNEE